MTLYHGSRFLNTDTLHPAFYYTKELVRWDQFEDNSWLYATTNRDEAIRQGFYSLLSAHLDIHRIQSAPGRIVIELYPDDQQSDHSKAMLKSIREQGGKKWLEPLFVYLYRLDESGFWQKNNNPANGLTTEYKTQHPIPVLTYPEKINMKDWLEKRGYTLELVQADHRPYFMRW